MTLAYTGTSSAAAVVAERVRERLRAERTDPTREPELATRIVHAEVRRHNDFALARGLTPVDDEGACVREVLAAVAGYGPLQPYLDDPTVEELWINAPDRILSKRQTLVERAPDPTGSERGGADRPAAVSNLDHLASYPVFVGSDYRSGYLTAVLIGADHRCARPKDVCHGVEVSVFETFAHA